MALAPRPRGAKHSGSVAMAFAALGVVFGDIGTSPLYTYKTVLGLTGGQPDAEVIMGSLSLIVWTLILITTVKYVTIAMSMNNDGEGGILALMALLALKRNKRPLIVAFGLFGAALIYGDGAITPAISVLSALEGLNIAFPDVGHYVLPGAIVVLVLLFAIQPLGTARIGRAFGPIMALWFLTIAILGGTGIARNPHVLVSLNPYFGLHYLLGHGYQGFLVLGGVFLAVTGAEALYADMGHFGSAPIRIGWTGIVFPSLLLNYAGQAAAVLGGAPITDNIFFRLCPAALLVPLVVLATLATVIASQSIITGAFSMTRQAILLGWMPRLSIKQTSAEGYGQIYVGAVNWALAAVTVGLCVFFGKSDNLAAAYGIAVSLTMLMTSCLLYLAMRDIWQWGPLVSGALTLLLVGVDGSFFAANAVKVLEGGYVPLLLAAAVFTVMLIWHRGTSAVSSVVSEQLMSIRDFTAQLTSREIARVPGTAVFLTRTTSGVPPVMNWHVKHNRSLHRWVLVLTVITECVPWVAEDQRLKVEQLDRDFWRAAARYGFMERPDIPRLLVETQAFGCTLDLADVTYYVGHETIVRRELGQRLPLWEESFYAVMVRNAARVSEVLKLPPDQVVEIGRQISI